MIQKYNYHAKMIFGKINILYKPNVRCTIPVILIVFYDNLGCSLNFNIWLLLNYILGDGAWKSVLLATLPATPMILKKYKIENPCTVL